MAQSWPGGLVAGVTGPDLVTVPYVSFSGTARFLDNANALASDSNAGTNPSFPMKTLQAVLTASATFDPVIIGANHDETLTTAIVMSGAPTLIGCVSGAAMPRIRIATVAATGITVQTEVGAQFHNIRFTDGGAGPYKVSVQVDDVLFKECIFEQGLTNFGIRNTGFNRMRVQGCSFLAVATGAKAAMVNAGTMVGLEIEDTDFDGSIYGWASANGCFNFPSACTKTRLKNVDFLRGSVGTFGAGSTYQQFRVFSDMGGNAIVTS